VSLPEPASKLAAGPGPVLVRARERGRGSVCIVGAGIVGCASAYALARDGWRVTLVDAASAPAQGASFANGAQLSYGYVEPLATLATLRSLPGWLLARNGPARWRPRADRAHWAWLAAFVRASWPAAVQRHTEALLALSFLSRDTLHDWLSAEPGLGPQVGHAQPGKLVLYREPGKRPAVQQQLQRQAALGCRKRLVSAAECSAIEPALKGAQGVAFGVWMDSEELVDAALLARALAHTSGAQLRLGEAVHGLLQHGGRIVGVQAGTERIEADHVVLAAGAGLNALVRPLGWRWPVEPLKGHSVSLALARPADAPRVSITDHARKIVFARLGDMLRVAGFAELMGDDTTIDAARIGALCAAADAMFPGVCDTRKPGAWAGLRPATPGGLPLIGATPWPNLWLNGGHGGLGLTLAAGSAALLCGLIAGADPAIDPRPYRP